MAVKQTAHGKMAHADSKVLFLLLFAWVAGECPAWIANQEMILIHNRNIT